MTTKPWEETWEVFVANKGFPAFAAKIGEHEVRVFESMSGEDDDIPRVQLAAAAPEMARLLIEIYNRVSDPLADRVVEVLEKAGVLTVAKARVTLT